MSLKIWQFQQKVFRLNRNSPTKERVTPSPLRHVIITGPLMNNSWHVFLCTPPQRCIFPINLRKYGAIVADEWLPPFGGRKPTFGNPNVTLIELGVIFFSSVRWKELPFISISLSVHLNGMWLWVVGGSIIIHVITVPCRIEWNYFLWISIVGRRSSLPSYSSGQLVM